RLEKSGSTLFLSGSENTFIDIATLPGVGGYWVKQGNDIGYNQGKVGVFQGVTPRVVLESDGMRTAGKLAVGSNNYSGSFQTFINAPNGVNPLLAVVNNSVTALSVNSNGSASIGTQSQG